MSDDIQKRHFYRDVITHLEEIIELYEEAEFAEEEADEDDQVAFDEKSKLDTFINMIRDSLILAEENS